ncbi:MAG: VOC family protein [Actinomycetota bacterium]
MSVATPLADGGRVDHIFWGVPDTEAAVEMLALRTGVRANIGMRPEPSFPTLAAAISLGHERFFEIHGPNPEYDGPDHFLHGLLSSLREPRLLLWYARSTDLDRTAEQLEAAGERFEPWAAAADEWDNADLSTYRAGCIAGENLNPSIPYLIEWRDRSELDTKLVTGMSLSRLWVTAKDPARTTAVHEMLGIDIPIESAVRDGFFVELDTPNGLVLVE